MVWFFAEGIRAMRTHLALGEAASVTRSFWFLDIGLRFPAESRRFRQAKRVQIPSVGFGLAESEFVQRGWRGEFPSGDRRDRGATTSATW